MSEQRDDMGERIAAALDERVEALDAETRSRLARARNRALAARRRSAIDARWLGLGTATATLLAAVVWFNLGPSVPRESPLPGIVEFEGLSSDFELVEELDFFLWLEAEAVGADDA